MPKLRKRYAGKTFPAEKYAVEKSNQFFERNFTCVAPAYELFYVWNIFSMTSKDESLLKPICQRLDKSLAELPFDSPVDERCTLLLLKGVSSKYMKDYEDAVKCFNEILEKWVLSLMMIESELTDYYLSKQWERTGKIIPGAPCITWIRISLQESKADTWGKSHYRKGTIQIKISVWSSHSIEISWCPQTTGCFRGWTWLLNAEPILFKL